MLEAFLNAVELGGLPAALLALAAFIYFFAGLVKGTLGIGFPTTAVSLLAQFTDARTAISVVIIPMIVTNAWQVWRSRQVYWVVSSFWRMLVVSVIFIVIFTQLSSVVSAESVTVFLGVVISFYAITTLYKPIFKIPDQKDKQAQIIAGVASGVMGGVAGVWAPPIIMYLSARGVTKEQFVATAGVLLFSGSLVLFVAYWNAELVGPSVAIASCFLLIPSMLGMVLGERIRHVLSAKRFEKLLLITFLIMGLNLIRRAIW